MNAKNAACAIRDVARIKRVTKTRIRIIYREKNRLIIWIWILPSPQSILRALPCGYTLLRVLTVFRFS